MVSVDVFVVNFNTPHLLQQMFGAMDDSSKEFSLRYLIVDNASSDDSVSVLKSTYSKIFTIFNDKNVGFGRANNQLLKFVQGDYVLLLNTDAFVSPNTLSSTLDYMATHPECGVLGVRLNGRDGELQPSCRYFPTPLNVFLTRTGLGRLMPWVRPVDDMAWDHASVRECDWVPGCYYLIRREVVDRVGLFDPRYFLYCEEVDHCKRVKEAGWKVLYYPHTSVVHLGGESAKSAGALTSAGRQISGLQIESELLYFRKHHGLAGLLLHMLLVVLGDAYLAFKAFLKRQGAEVLASSWAHTSLTWKLLQKTRFGTRPTR